MADQLTTWDELRRDVAAMYEAAEGAYDGAADNLMHGATHAEVFPDLADDMAALRDRLDKLVSLLTATSPPPMPARSLEAVLADIEAEGHLDIDLRRYSWADGETTWRCDTKTGTLSPPFPSKGSDEERKQWRRLTETGEAYGTTATAAAEARLADIRALRAPKVFLATSWAGFLTGLGPSDADLAEVDAWMAEGRAAPVAERAVVAEETRREAEETRREAEASENPS
jgi:hypothetical protein